MSRDTEEKRMWNLEVLAFAERAAKLVAKHQQAFDMGLLDRTDIDEDGAIVEHAKNLEHDRQALLGEAVSLGLLNPEDTKA